MAEPREPDRFEAKARELVDLFVTTGTHITEMRSSLATALRQAAEEALERAAQDYERAHSYHRGLHGSLAVAAHLRALASPAAAPAADVCRAEVASRMPDYSHYECTLPKGHAGPHKEGSFAEWTDATTVAAPPSEPAAPSLLPRVLAALENPESPGEVADVAAELRRYIAEMEADGGR